MKEEEMDPTQNPFANPNPAPAPENNPGAPEAPAAAASAAPAQPASVEPAAPVAPTAPAAPVAPAAPAEVNPMGAPTAAAAAQAGANPVTQPGGGGVVNPVQTEGLLATDPIMKPEPAPAPDPVQQELEAPMKAAAPVPGSIGSSISGDGKQAAPASKMPAFNNPFKKKETPSVAFNDPAMENDPNAQAAAPAGNMPIKKNNNKTTLIVLIAVAAVVIIVLIGILIATATGLWGGNDSNRLTNEDLNTEFEEPTEEEEEEAALTVIACNRAMTAEEAAGYGIAGGTISVMGTFDENDDLMMLTLAKYSSDMTGGTQVTDTTETVTADGTTGTTETTTETTTTETDAESSNNLLTSEQVAVEDLTPDMAATYYLTTDNEGNLVTTSSGMQAYWESLAFTCGEE